MMFSIIAPEYKQLHYLDKIKSAWDVQTLKDFELIISSDGIDDEVEAWCKQKNVKHAQHEKNGINYSKVVNDGAKMAEGDYLFICNCDSYPDPDCLEQLAKAAHPNKLISAIRVNVDQEGKIVSPDWRLDTIILNPDEDVVDIFNPNPWRYMTGNGILIPRALFWKLGGYYEGYGKGRQDWDFCFHAEAEGVGMAWCPKAKINHFYHGEWTDDPQDLQLFQKRWNELHMGDEERELRREEKKDIIFDVQRAKEKEEYRKQHLKEIEENNRRMEEEDRRS